MSEAESNILKAMDEAEIKAIDNLARYKFCNFGYHAANWVNYNKLLKTKKPNPFSNLVNLSRSMRSQKIIQSFKHHTEQQPE